MRSDFSLKNPQSTLLFFVKYFVIQNPEYESVNPPLSPKKKNSKKQGKLKTVGARLEHLEGDPFALLLVPRLVHLPEGACQDTNTVKTWNRDRRLSAQSREHIVAEIARVKTAF